MNADEADLRGSVPSPFLRGLFIPLTPETGPVILKRDWNFRPREPSC